MIATTAADAGQAGIDLDVPMDEPVFIIAASHPHAPDLLTCLAMMSREDGPTEFKRVRKMQRQALTWQREHGGAK